MFVFFCLIEKQFILNLNGNTLQHEFTHKSTVFFLFVFFASSLLCVRHFSISDPAAVSERYSSCIGKIAAVSCGEKLVLCGLRILEWDLAWA